jgi:ribonucleoside-diphosphate reductase alpha chain
MNELHDLAKKQGWSIDDIPEWGNNSLYLTTMLGGYLQNKETPKEAYNRIASTAATYLNKPELFSKFFEILWNGWLIPSTPVMSNFGTNRGLPISCFGGYIGDSMYDIYRKNLEMAILSKHGGGTAYDFSEIRPKGALIKDGSNGTTDGIIPFMKSFDSTIIASKQGKMRRGAVALYLSANHPEFADFLKIREPKGDINRQCHNIHMGAKFSNEFMEEVVNKNGSKRELWLEHIKTRVKTGEPYTFFTDNANANLKSTFSTYNLKVRHSQLCAEIMLPSDENHTFVCCLSSMNLYKWEEWSKTDAVYYATIFLDAVISEFLDKAKHIQGIEDSIRFAEKSRALGLGALGWASLLQKMRIPFIGIQATSLTRVIFSHMKEKSDKASMWMANEFGEPTWCKGSGYRNLTCLAVAPNRSSSKLAGGVSQGIEPFAANLYMDDDAKGAHLRRNPDLETLLDEKGLNTPQTWDIIAEDKGSVKNIDELTEEEKEIFRTFKEINQLELVRQAAVRQEYIDQGQSLNLAFFHDAPAKWINQVHIEAWKLGIKALYYLRSESNLRADSKQQRDLYSECIVCEG